MMLTNVVIVNKHKNKVNISNIFNNFNNFNIVNNFKMTRIFEIKGVVGV
jgi:hypothetical protein